MMSSAKHYIRWFEEIGIDDVALVGGKNASLGELYRELTSGGIKVPNGFAITAEAYWDLLRRTKLDQRIKEILAGLDTQDSANLRQRGNAIRRELTEASLPDDLQREILAAYHKLCEGATEPVDVAVRSSATAEDLPDASFAGQQETYLNVQGDAALLESCKRCFASLFTDRAISYRQDKGFEDLKVGLSIGIQRMVRSDLASSGSCFPSTPKPALRTSY
jgi:pyruvate, water dikinase